MSACTGTNAQRAEIIAPHGRSFFFLFFFFFFTQSIQVFKKDVGGWEGGREEGRGKTEEEELEGEEEDGGGETAKWLADASSSCTVIFAHSVKLYCSSHHAVFRESVCVCVRFMCAVIICLALRLCTHSHLSPWWIQAVAMLWF